MPDPMTTLTTEIRALLARVPTGYTPGPWSWLFGPGQDYYEMCAQDSARYPGLSIYDHGAATENLDLAALAPELAAALAQAVAALADQPPAADAALLASANRALCERLEAAEANVLGKQYAAEVFHARAAAAERALADSSAAVVEWRGRAQMHRTALDDSERALAESRAEVERLRGHAEALRARSVGLCRLYLNGRPGTCADPGCPVPQYRRDYPEPPAEEAPVASVLRDGGGR